MTTETEPPAILLGCSVLPPMVPIDVMQDGPATAVVPRKTPGRAPPVRRRTAGRFTVLNDFLDVTMGTLPRSQIIVWLLLYRDTRDGIARTSQADLARRGRLGRRTVGLAIRVLGQKGLLRVVYRGGLNRGPSRYMALPLRPCKEPAQAAAP